MVMARTAQVTRRRSHQPDSLLNRGVVIAIAHIRGGGEMGRKWYEDGKLCTKITPSPILLPVLNI